MSEEYKTLSASTDEPQLLSQDGGIMLRDFNPKAILRFTGRKCLTCSQEILDHWLIYDESAEMRGLYWCDKEAKQWSEGIQGTVWDVPKGFGQ